MHTGPDAARGHGGRRSTDETRAHVLTRERKPVAVTLP